MVNLFANPALLRNRPFQGTISPMTDHDSGPVFVHGWLSPSGVQWLRRIFAFLFNTLAHIQVSGLENLPASGGFIIAPNHLSRLDPPLVFSVLKGRAVTAFIASTYRRQPFFRAILQAVDVIWVQRGSIGPSTLKVAIQALRRGTVMGIAPEGTRSPTGALIEGKTGAVFLAVAAGVPIVPAAVNHSEKILPALLHFRRQTVTVTFGKPVNFSAAAGRRPDSQTLETFTTELMCQIAALLPLDRRGIYADQPRLKELLAQAS